MRRSTGGRRRQRRPRGTRQTSWKNSTLVFAAEVIGKLNSGKERSSGTSGRSRELLIDGVSVVEHSPGPRTWMCKEPYLRRGLAVVLLASLLNLSCVLFEQTIGPMRWLDARTRP